MGILDSISHSSAKTGIRVVIAGVEKSGKTTLCCNAPTPLLIPLEQGYSGVSVHKVQMLEHFMHIITLLDEILEKCKEGAFGYQSLVFDSATALERHIHQAVLESDPAYVKGNSKAVTMTSALGGYGKAYELANEYFTAFLARCDMLAVYYGINIVLTCHVFAAKVVDPAFGEYDTWDIQLHSPKNQKTYGKREMISQWADVLGYLHEPFFVSEGKTMNKGVSQNKGRILAVNRTPNWVAGNRFGVVNDIAIPKEQGWNHLAKAIYDASGFDCYNRDVPATPAVATVPA